MFEQKKNEISVSRKDTLNKFQKKLGIKFKNLSLLNLAFYHRSVMNELGKASSGHETCNERLEFLGDAVQDMIVATYLYEKLPNQSEGFLSQVKSVVVSEPSLAQIALDIGVKNCLVLGHGEEKSGGRDKKAILADCVEAVIGALYLDQGFKETEKFVLSLMIPRIENVLHNHGQKDSKTLLQEWFQKEKKMCPRYELVSTTGPEHQKVFNVVVHLGDKVVGPECGFSKKEAEQKVAQLALNKMKID